MNGRTEVWDSNDQKQPSANVKFEWVATPRLSHSQGKITLRCTFYAAAAAKSLQSCLTLCDPTDSSPPGFSVPGILQARILEWVAISFSNACMHAKSLQSCLTLCDPMDSSPPGSLSTGFSRQEYSSGLPFPSPQLQGTCVKG